MSTAAVPDSFVKELGESLPEQPTPLTLGPRVTIFREGDEGSCAYLIESGAVRVWRDENGVRRTLAVLGPGDLLGEMSAIDNRRRSACATTTKETELTPITSRQLEWLLGQSEPILNLLVRVLTSRLRTTPRPSLPIGAPRDDSRPGDAAGSDPHFEAAREEAMSDIKLARTLREGLVRREFELHYQPIIDLQRMSLAGFEALIRWRSPEHGMVPPGRFIDTAERTGFIVDMGRWTMEHACHVIARLQRLRERRAPGEPPLFMSVNVSPQQLRGSAEVEDLAAIIARTGVDASWVKLEITERVLIDDPVSAAAALNRFQSMGAKVALDDFGTGYSSLAYLHRYPLDVIKIDRSFVSEMLEDRGNMRVVEAIAGLAHALDYSIVAEGVERPRQIEVLKKLGCQFAQGFLFSKPVPLKQAEAMIGVSSFEDYARPQPPRTTGVPRGESAGVCPS